MFNFILGLMIGGVGVWMVLRKRDSIVPPSAGLQNDNPNRAAIERKRENLARVMAMAKKKGEIRNDDVERGLGVSDKTAERYLEELVEQGKLTRIGSRGKYVIYKPI